MTLRHGQANSFRATGFFQGNRILAREPSVGAAFVSPAKYTGIKVNVVSGEPDARHVSTSYVERQNLSMRMGMRRFTRLTNAFSKKLANHEHAVALYFMHYNFAKIHTTLRITPVMAAGVTTKLWELEDIVALID